MAVIFLVTAYAFRVKVQGEQCDVSDAAIHFVMMLTGSLFALFVWFFVNAYVWKGNQQLKDKSA